MPLPQISEVDIQRLAGQTIFERGRRYYRGEQVFDLVLRGDLLYAAVQGSEYDPYQVSIRFGDDGLASAVCSCPYEGAVCKHVVAALLVVARQPELVEERPPLTATLDELTADQLRALLIDVAAQHPDIADFVEERAAGLGAPVQPGQPAAPPALDHQLTAIKRQVKQALGGGARGNWYGDDDNSGLALVGIDKLAEAARPYIEANDGHSATQILETITSELTRQLKQSDLYDYYYGEEESLSLEGLGDRWVEAVLCFDLSDADRREWAKKLNRWQQQLEQFGLESPFVAAIQAAREGWDTPALQRMLAGARSRTTKTALVWSDEVVDVARIGALRRAGRSEEALNLARALGRHVQVAELLLARGHADEAVAHAAQHFTHPAQSLQLAVALAEAGQLASATQIAAHGLELPDDDSQWAPDDDLDEEDLEYVEEYLEYAGGWAPVGSPRIALARHLRDWAVRLGQPALALDAAITLLGLAPTLADYKRAVSIDPGRWPQERERALNQVRNASGYGLDLAKAEILLHEGDVDGAIAIADAMRSDDLVGLVARTVSAERPDWVIKACTRKAEEIMDGGQSARYDAAAEWLKLVRAAYLAAGRAAEWRLLLGQLLALHRRKYKLVPLLEAIK